MQEYKRERDTLASQLKDAQKKAVDHDDHLRVIDAWWSQVILPQSFSCISTHIIQLLDEVSLLAQDKLPETDADSESQSLVFHGSF